LLFNEVLVQFIIFNEQTISYASYIKCHSAQSDTAVFAQTDRQTITIYFSVIGRSLAPRSLTEWHIYFYKSSSILNLKDTARYQCKPYTVFGKSFIYLSSDR